MLHALKTGRSQELFLPISSFLVAKKERQKKRKKSKSFLRDNKSNRG
jgi:hypothetical protein